MTQEELQGLILAARTAILDTNLNIIRLNKELHEQKQLGNQLKVELEKLVVEKYR